MKHEETKSLRAKVPPYVPATIEKKWQKKWANAKLYKSVEPKGAAPAALSKGASKKYYILDMFPYPSGEGLHVGHPKGYIATDVISRMKRMQGYSVLHPMGFDAFGLPAENYALKTKTHPAESVAKNVARYKKQLEILGFDYDWSREINTTDPAYYKWTQWIFLKLLERGLAYESYEPINWCPSCKTGLANEDVEDGRCERCGTLVEKKPMRQWVLRITDYAERMLADLDARDPNDPSGATPLLDWPHSIKELQRNWIGKSQGAELPFSLHVPGVDPQTVSIFTTRPDTLFGVTYIVLAPEHPFVKAYGQKAENWSEVAAYIELASRTSSIDRTDVHREKTGVVLKGITALNPLSKKTVPVFVGDYVLADYGTGAVMGVPAHDSRDYEFASRYKLPIVSVITTPEDHEGAYIGPGILRDSGTWTNQNSETSMSAMTKAAGGKEVTRYKLRDWVFSRQRYWGEPIPVIHCPTCGIVPVPEKELPVKLPKVKFYEPTGTGESPLAAIEKWVNVKCPRCRGKARRETNTMPQWAGSSWYYLRYMDPKNKKALVGSTAERFWQPVDMYVGGAEHATRHLIYARFWHKFLFDIGVVSGIEPFKRLQHVGLIMGSDGRKMSKRFGNVINPDDIVGSFGADTMRLYEMFMGPFDQSIAWNTDSMVGSRRFIERVWTMGHNIIARSSETKINAAIDVALHKAIKKVSEDIESMHFNTAVSELMTCLNVFEKTSDEIDRAPFSAFLRLLAPFAPHMTEELWMKMGNKKSIHIAPWPDFDPAKLIASTVVLAVQVNGKVRGEITVRPDTSDADIEKAARSLPEIGKWLEGKTVKKVIVVKGRLISFVVA